MSHQVPPDSPNGKRDVEINPAEQLKPTPELVEQLPAPPQLPPIDPPSAQLLWQAAHTNPELRLEVAVHIHWCTLHAGAGLPSNFDQYARRASVFNAQPDDARFDQVDRADDLIRLLCSGISRFVHLAPAPPKPALWTPPVPGAPLPGGPT